MKKQALMLAVAVLLGVLAVWLPSVVDPTAPVMGSWVRAAVERPSVWTFQGFFVGGFLLGIFALVAWIDLPLLAVAMVGWFPLKAGIEMLQGSTGVRWPQEFFLYAAWLIPALLGLSVGKLIRDIQRKSRRNGRSDRKRSGR